MTRPLRSVLVGCGLLLSAGCQKTPAPPVSALPTCANEQTLEVYQNWEAVVAQTQLDTYCLIADSAAIATNSFPLTAYLVPQPTSALPAQSRLPGLHVRFSGRKQSCYGLTTLPNLAGLFGYKLEPTAIQAK